MNKIALTLAALCLAGSTALANMPAELLPIEPVVTNATEFKGTRAANTMEFSYAGQPDSSTGIRNLPVGTYVFQAFQMSPEDVALFKGNKITDIFVYGGSDGNRPAVNPDTDVTVFISNSLSKAPVCEQKGTLKQTAYGKNYIKLDTPYEIKENEILFIGFRFQTSETSAFYVVVDGITNDKQTGLVATSSSADMPAATNWQNVATQYGSICMGVILEGETLPNDYLTLSQIISPECVELGNEPVYTLSVYNQGCNPVTNLDIQVEATGEETYVKKVYPSRTITANVKVDTDVKLNPFTTEGKKDVKLTILKVNDKDNVSTSSAKETSVISVKDGFERVVMIEEGTGTNCGWCPSGLVMLEYLKEKYRGKVAMVSIHIYDKWDEMYCGYYQDWYDSLGTGFPFAWLNRTELGHPQNGKTVFDNSIDRLIANPQFVGLELGDATFDGNTATFEGTAQFCIDTDSRYRVSLALAEDKVGPYLQGNYYSTENVTGSAGYLEGWTEKPRRVEMLFDDVARDISGFPGENLTDGAITKGTKYPVSFKMEHMDTFQGDIVRAIMIITDSLTGAVLNATQKTYSISGVKNITETNNAETVIYTLDGVKMATKDVNTLPAGVYIVKNGNKTVKVIR